MSDALTVNDNFLSVIPIVHNNIDNENSPLDRFMTKRSRNITFSTSILVEIWFSSGYEHFFYRILYLD